MAGQHYQEVSATGSANLQGKATNVASRKDNGTVKIRARFTPASPLRLDRATLTLTHLLHETAGLGELVRQGVGRALPPLVLPARRGSKPTDTIYQTPSGVRPSVTVEIKTKNAKTGLLELSIAADRALIPLAPAQCGGGRKATAQVRTRLTVDDGVNPATGGRHAAPVAVPRQRGQDAVRHVTDVSSPTCGTNLSNATRGR